MKTFVKVLSVLLLVAFVAVMVGCKKEDAAKPNPMDAFKKTLEGKSAADLQKMLDEKAPKIEEAQKAVDAAKKAVTDAGDKATDVQKKAVTEAEAALKKLNDEKAAIEAAMKMPADKKDETKKTE